MAQKPTVSVKYSSDSCDIPPEMEGTLMACVRDDLNQRSVRKYWEYIGGVTVCIAGPNQAYIYVEFHGLNWRELSPYHGKPARLGGRYWTFSEVRFSARYWLPRIRKALADGADYRGLAAEVERRMRDCWHQERFNFWAVVDGANAVLRKMSILGGYRLQLTAFKIPKEGDPMPHRMDIRPLLSLDRDAWIDHPLGDLYTLVGKNDEGKPDEKLHDRLVAEAAQQDPSYASGMRRLIDTAKRIGVLKENESQHREEIGQLQEQADTIRRQLRQHLASRDLAAQHASEG